MLSDILKDPTRRNVIINTLGNYINVFFTALFALILVRILSPSEYGILSVLLGISYVLSNVLDFGTTATIYSYVPTMYAENDKRLYQFIKSTFFYQSLFSIIVIGTLFIVFPYLDRVFFKTHVPSYVLNLTAFSTLLFIWQNFFTNILFAAKKFMRANIYINIANIIKTVVILYLGYIGMISVGIIIFVFGVVGPIIFFVLILFENKNKIPHLYLAPIRKEEFRFGYTLTYFLSSQFYNLGLRMDLFLISYFGLTLELGYYGLAQKIILTIIASIVSITQVLSPRFATIHTKKESREQLKTAFWYLIWPSLIFVALYFTPRALFELVFTKNFTHTEAATKALAIPFVLSAIGSVPVLFLLYTVKKPIYILYGNIVFFTIISVGSYYLIPVKGMFGPPVAIFWAFIAATLIQTVAMWIEYRKLPS
jgi:PST family polysaccharide transporter